MQATLGQTILVENVTGAAGSLGVGRVVRSAPAAAVAAMNDSDVRQQLENLGLRMPAKDQLTPEAPGAWQKAEKNRLTGSLRRLLAIWAALQFL